MPFDAVMSRATSRFFERSTRLDLGGAFPARPAEMNAVVDALLERAAKEAGG
jgi:hypothetical protein